MNALPAPTKIVCVGLNYAGHAKELDRPVPDEPLLFLKPPSAIVGSGEPICIPPGIGRVDHEGEIGLRIGRRASHVSARSALDYVAGVLPVNDVTARDVQRVDHQWTRAKGVDTFFPMGPTVPLDRVDLDSLSVVTRVNEEVRQRGSVREMVVPPGELLAYITRIMTLEPGDVVTTGTPEGVGSLVPWDEVEVVIPGVSAVRNPVRMGRGAPWSITARAAP